MRQDQVLSEPAQSVVNGPLRPLLRDDPAWSRAKRFSVFSDDGADCPGQAQKGAALGSTAAATHDRATGLPAAVHTSKTQQPRAGAPLVSRMFLDDQFQKHLTGVRGTPGNPALGKEAGGPLSLRLKPKTGRQ